MDEIRNQFIAQDYLESTLKYAKLQNMTDDKSIESGLRDELRDNDRSLHVMSPFLLQHVLSQNPSFIHDVFVDGKFWR